MHLVYISKMPREKKTPQLKKQLELEKDHFTFSNAPHAFRKNWKKKKSQLTRQYRRKSDEILSIAKPEISAADAEVLVGNVTAKLLQKSVLKRRLRKNDTVTVGEKIQTKLDNRARRVNRRIDHIRHYDLIAKSAVTTLVALQGEDLEEILKRIGRAVRGGDPIEWMRLYQSTNQVDRAIFFVQEIAHGNAYYLDALRRDQGLCESFQNWKRKANRILAKQLQPAQRKLEQKIATDKKVKAMLRKNRQS